MYISPHDTTTRLGSLSAFHDQNYIMLYRRELTVLTEVVNRQRASDLANTYTSQRASAPSRSEDSTGIKSLIRVLSHYAMWDILFPEDITEEDREERVTYLLNLSNKLTPDDELLCLHIQHKGAATEQQKDPAVTPPKVGAAFESFGDDGSVMVEAYILICGYGIESVVGLTPTQVSTAVRLASSAPGKLPWSSLVEYLTADIDSTLVESLWAGSSNVHA
jgi:hypothetical protein